jgi:hypothetical protein
MGVMDNLFRHEGRVLGGAFRPRLFRVTEVPNDAVSLLAIIRSQLDSIEDPSFFPLGISIFKVGFSKFFSVPAVTVLATKKLSPSQVTSTSQATIPVVVCEGRFEELSDTSDGQGSGAEELITGGLKGYDLRRRVAWMNTQDKPIRAPSIPRPIMHGTSIGLAEGPELKGSACVYVHPTISNDTFRAEQKYLLTAAHVVLPMGYPEQSLLVPFDDSTTIVPPAKITTPGRLDAVLLLNGMHKSTRDCPFAKDLVQAASTPCGKVVSGRLGVDKEDWREDWALIELDEVYRGQNGVFWDSENFRDLLDAELDEKTELHEEAELDEKTELHEEAELDEKTELHEEAELDEKTELHEESELDEKTEPHEEAELDEKTELHEEVELDEKTEPHEEAELDEKTEPHEEAEPDEGPDGYEDDISREGFRTKVGSMDLGSGSSELKWYKDGAQTGWSAGKVSRVIVELFLKGTTFSVSENWEPHVHPANVVRAKVLCLEPEDGVDSMAKSGDSGAPLFATMDRGKNFVWGGMVVSTFYPKDGGASLAMAVPQSQILAQLGARTGISWEFS